MKKTFKLHLLLAFCGSILFAPFSQAAQQQPSKEQVTTVCTAHYTNLITDIIGALNMGMSVDDIKKNLSGKSTISKQMSILFGLVDLLPTDKEQEKYAAFNALVDQCIADNFNKPRKV